MKPSIIPILLAAACGNSAATFQTQTPRATISDEDSEASKGSFVSLWEIPAGDETITLPLVENGDSDFTVDWGTATLQASHPGTARRKPTATPKPRNTR